MLIACVASSVAFAQSTDAPETESGWTFVVIKLNYASAGEVAAVLQAVLPPTVRVAPYYPTNSLIVSGDPAIIARLTADEEEPSAPSD